jgi:hypothetical protein
MTIKCILNLFLMSVSVTCASWTTIDTSPYNKDVMKCLSKYNYEKSDCYCEYYRDVWVRQGKCERYYYNGEGTSYRPNNQGWDNICAECCCQNCKFLMRLIVIC